MHAEKRPNSRASVSARPVGPTLTGADHSTQPLPKKEWLRWYAGQFATTEVNGSFYRTPSLDAVRAWRHCHPRRLLFAWKASKFITHWKRLNPDTCENSIDLMITRLKVLGSKAGPVLFQLPAHFEPDRERLARFIKMLPRPLSLCLRIPSSSWYERPSSKSCATTTGPMLVGSPSGPAPWKVTARHVYVRGHGPDGRYKEDYSDKTLRLWAQRIRRWRDQGKLVFVYFDNDQKSVAPADAHRLATLLALLKAPLYALTFDLLSKRRHPDYLAGSSHQAPLQDWLDAPTS